MSDPVFSPATVRPRRGRRRLDEGPALDRKRLVAKLMELARAEGIEALNMRRVAQELGVSARLLYHHVRDKDEMVELLADEITGLQMPDLDQGDWEQRLRNVVASTRAAYEQFRGIPAIILSRSLRTLTSPNAMRIRRGVLKALRDAGLTEEQAEIAFVQFSVIVLGSLVLHENLDEGDEAVAVARGRVEQGIDLGLDLLLFGIRRLASGQAILPERH